MNLKCISFEGGEGSGKGTLIYNLKGLLTAQGVDFIYAREPGGTVLGEALRECILGENSYGIAYESEILLFAAARAQLLKEVVRPAIAEGKLVLLDRYVDSSYVYQGYVRGNIEAVQKINEIATANFLPDITFWLDIDPEIGLSRIFSSNREVNRIDKETLDFHKKVREGYQYLAERTPRIATLDATKAPELLAAETLTIINLADRVKAFSNKN